MQHTEKEYKNLLGLLPIGAKPDTKVLGKILEIKPKRLARLMNGTASKVQVSELQKIANHYQVNIKELFN